jgi:hypothetical protein
MTALLDLQLPSDIVSGARVHTNLKGDAAVLILDRLDS